MVNQHRKDSLSDFIFDDNYFEDSWGLHSDLFATCMHQMNIFIPDASLRVAASCNISAEMSKQPTHTLKALHLENMENKTERKYYSPEKSSMLDQTDHNMNGMFVCLI
ncbi:unnamed protein product [Cercopithifilaria johnstoni]|uniref:Uncharacterized protein n=1 Tax=Cercopithifilaria johnstoni TaxID=2874296 RepID=A0A8J2MBH8_9BILA|nr:unnamed protein product [Cercopithifilaria johnstoni]